MDSTIVDMVVEQLKELPQEMQRRVLDFTRALASTAPRGVSGQELLQFAGTISEQDAAEMRDAIEQACEQVDENEW